MKSLPRKEEKAWRVFLTSELEVELYEGREERRLARREPRREGGKERREGGRE